MSSQASAPPPSVRPEQPDGGLILEGAPPGSGRPSWLLLVIAVVVALAAGTALGYSVAASPKPTPAPSPSAVPSSSPSPSLTAAPTPTATPLPSVAGFTTFTSPVADAAWTGLQWLRLAPGDALASVITTVRWSHGFIAIGQPTSAGDSARTSVWASSDGVSWQALDPGVFGPSTFVVGAADGSSGLVALSVQAGTNGCAPGGTCWGIAGPMQTWTSPDGTNWTAHPGPNLALTTNSGNPRLVVGPAGFLATVPDTGPPGGSGPIQAALSADGVTWQTLGSSAFPAGFRLSDVCGTPAGYLAVGAQEVDPEHEKAAALWSTDGRHWTASGPMQIASRTGMLLVATAPSWTAGTVVAGRSGFIVTGGTGGAPGAQLWWQSGDAQHWQVLSAYPPLGAQPGEGEGAGGQPYGVLLGDGQRMIAVRGGPQAAAWSSLDGRTWTKLAISGDVPSEQAFHATLFPGGVLLSDGTTSWYGRATTR